MCGTGVTSNILFTSNPVDRNALRDADRPGPIPLIYTATSLMERSSIAFFNVDCTVTVAAYGVDFLVPAKPCIPQEPKTNGCPFSSVTVTRVLL